MGIFQYDFMTRAFIVGVLLAIIIPCIGVIVVLKRLSMIGDALSHSSLAGVSAGLIMGINPILGAMVFCIAAALSIELIRKKFKKYSEIAIAIVMSAGVSLAGVLSGFVKQSANFNSFLFGSIVSISDNEFKMVIIVGALVFIAFVLLYKELFYVAFDERLAKIAGIPVNTVNFVFTVMTAITVSIASRTVGSLMVSSIMIVPVACSMMISKSYKKTLIYAILFAVFFTIVGLMSSFYLSLRPGASITLTGVICFILMAVVFKAFKNG